MDLDDLRQRAREVAEAEPTDGAGLGWIWIALGVLWMGGPM